MLQWIASHVDTLANFVSLPDNIKAVARFVADAPEWAWYLFALLPFFFLWVARKQRTATSPRTASSFTAKPRFELGGPVDEATFADIQDSSDRQFLKSQEIGKITVKRAKFGEGE